MAKKKKRSKSTAAGRPKQRKKAAPRKKKPAAAAKRKKVEASTSATPSTIDAPPEVIVNPGSDRARLLDDFLDTIELPHAERMKLIAPIAEGGMGALCTVRDLAIQREVAKKTIHERLQDDRRALFLFMREARITGQLDHPNIVPVHEAGIDADGALFFTMKRVSGRTLGDLYRELPPGPIDRDTLLNLLDIFIKVCDAIAFAHSRGVLHCDLKPANVMVGEFGQVYVMDWGIARVLKDHTTDVFVARDLKKATVVSTFSIMGTPAYMSPEQTLGERQALDPRTDVFALGAMLYKLFVGHPPFPITDAEEAVKLERFANYERPSTAAPSRAVPLGIEQIINRAVAIDREARFQSVRELRDELERYVREGAEFPLQRIPAGTTLIREGDEADCAYIIHRGRCAVRRVRGNETETLNLLEPGDVFGETAILSPGPRTADVVTLEETEVFVIAKSALEAELTVMKPWLAHVLRTVADRFRDANEG